MQTQYPTTYDYMLNAIECCNVTSLCSFTLQHRVEILKHFFHDVTAERLVELNDAYIPDTRLEVAFVHSDSMSLRYQGINLLWDKYEKELSDIFDKADTDNFRAMGGISEHEEWRRADLSQRCRDIAAETNYYRI